MVHYLKISSNLTKSPANRFQNPNGKCRLFVSRHFWRGLARSGNIHGVLLSHLVTSGADVVAIRKVLSADATVTPAENFARHHFGCGRSCGGRLQLRSFQLRLLWRVVVGHALFVKVVADSAFVKMASADDTAVSETAVHNRPSAGDGLQTYLGHVAPQWVVRGRQLTTSKDCTFVFEMNLQKFWVRLYFSKR